MVKKLLINDMELLSLVKYFVVMMNFAFIYVLKKSSQQSSAEERAKNAEKPCLLVTAHPDDESMFFVPLIRGLKELGYKVHLLCFSNGNSKIREDELSKASKFLGFESWQVLDLKSEGIIDGMRRVWDLEVIAEQIGQKVAELGAKGIFTFDRLGVSGHINHSAIFEALRDKKSDFAEQKIYALESVDILRKYVFPLRMLVELLSEFGKILAGLVLKNREEEDRHVFYNWSLPLVWRAMGLHRSQFVWFRRLSVIFSSYSYINTLKKL